MSNALTTQRNEILAGMTDAARELAKSLESKLSKLSTTAIMVNYETGLKLSEALADEAKYGANLVEQLASYLGYSNPTTLYNCRNFAEAFEKAYIEELCKTPAANGMALTYSHFVAVLPLKKQSQREKLLELAKKQGLSVTELLAEVRSRQESADKGGKGKRGRKQKMPASVEAGLSKIKSLSQKLDNFLVEILPEAIVSRLEEISPDSVSERLLTSMDEAGKQLKQTQDDIASALIEIGDAQKRISEILEAAAEAADEEAAEADEEGDEDEEPVVKKKKGGKKGGKKVARRRPAAV